MDPCQEPGGERQQTRLDDAALRNPRRERAQRQAANEGVGHGLQGHGVAHSVATQLEFESEV